MANGVTSQWEDLQIKAGNFEAREKVETIGEQYAKNQEKIEGYDPFTKKTLDELDELDDDFDEAFLAQYKQKRLKELEAEGNKPKFGRVFEISREDYVDQVTKASTEAFVVLHLYQDYVQECVLVNQLLDEIAVDRPTVKFVKIVATRCTEKFPDSNCPCFLIYRNGTIVSNLPMVHKYLKKITYNALEYLLKEQGVFRSLEEDDQDNEEQVQQIKAPVKQARDDEDPIDDREYSTNQKFYKKYM